MYFIMALILLVAVLLILAVLMQNSKGGGLSSQFGGAATQLIGARKSTDLLEKITWGLVTALFVLSLFTVRFTGEGFNAGGLDKEDLDGIETVTPEAPPQGETPQEGE